MKKFLTTTLDIVAWLSIIPGLFMGIVGFVRSLDSYGGDKFIPLAITGFSMFMGGLILLSLSYIVEAACIYIEKNK